MVSDAINACIRSRTLKKLGSAYTKNILWKSREFRRKFRGLTYTPSRLIHREIRYCSFYRFSLSSKYITPLYPILLFSMQVFMIMFSCILGWSIQCHSPLPQPWIWSCSSWNCKGQSLVDIIILVVLIVNVK